MARRKSKTNDVKTSTLVREVERLENEFRQAEELGEEVEREAKRFYRELVKEIDSRLDAMFG